MDAAAPISAESAPDRAETEAAVARARLAQEVADTAERARLGGAFYVAAWILVGVAGGVAARAPLTYASLGLPFVLLMAARFMLRAPRHDVVSASAETRWLRRIWTVVLATAGLWGIASFWVLRHSEFGPAQPVVLMASIAFGTAFAHNFCMRRNRALGAVALLYLPGLAALAATPDAATLATTLAIYLVYLVLVLLRSHQEYQRRLDLEGELRRERDRFERQSRRDGLTGLANRRRFAAALAGAVAAARTGAPAPALLILDLDHFKAVNDRFGHAVGDAALVALAARLRDAFPEADALPARLGGEEFAVLLTGASAAEAIRRAEAFRAALAATPLDLDGLPLRLTVSIGGGRYDPEHHADGDAFYRDVDRALYAAKEAGRDRLLALGA